MGFVVIGFLICSSLNFELKKILVIESNVFFRIFLVEVVLIRIYKLRCRDCRNEYVVKLECILLVV